MEVDLILQHLGGFGLFQMIIYFSVCFVSVRSVFHVLAIIFVGAAPAHHCTIPVNMTINGTIPGKFTNGEWVWDSCLMKDPLENKTISCPNGWTYGSGFTSTIVTEWNLVCRKNYLVDLATTIYMIGNAVMCIVLVPLSDRFGRKTVLLPCLWIQSALGIGLSFVKSIIPFMVLQFFIGGLNMTIALVSYCLMTEAFSSASRTIPSIALQFFWATGIMVLSLLGYLIRDWRILEVVISTPNLLTIVFVWTLPESIPWLVAKGKLKRAKKILQLAEKLNKVSLPSNVLQDSEKEVEPKPNHETGSRSDKMPSDTESQNVCTTSSGENLVSPQSGEITKYTVLDLVRSSKMCFYTVIMFFLWLVNSLSYFGTMFNIPTLHGNLYLNLFLSGVVELPAYIIGIFVIKYFGRQKTVCIFLLICGVANLAAVILSLLGSDTTTKNAVTGLAFVGKFGITGSYAIIYLYCAEIFPTVVRNQAMGYSSFFENMGSISAPLLMLAAKTNSQPKLPLIIFGVLTLVGGILVLLLPETHNRALPETIEEVERWEKTIRLRSKKKTLNICGDPDSKRVNKTGDGVHLSGQTAHS